MAPGCPIASEQRSQIPVTPQAAAQQREQSRKTVSPCVNDMQIAQQHVDQQRDPNLQLDRIGVVPQEVPQLQRLLKLLEEHFDAPAAAIGLRKDFSVKVADDFF